MDKLELTVEFEEIGPEDLYQCWLESETHAEMTGGEATGAAEVGAEFTAWDGYISGKILELDPGKRILQSWRTTEFDDDAADSKLELIFASNGEEGTILTLKHSDLPEGDGDRYMNGWEEHYFEPMRHYFGEETFVEDDEED